MLCHCSESGQLMNEVLQFMGSSGTAPINS